MSDSFSIDNLAEVKIPEMGFPWKVLEHFRDEYEMLAKVLADPESFETLGREFLGIHPKRSYLSQLNNISQISTLAHANRYITDPDATKGAHSQDLV